MTLGNVNFKIWFDFFILNCRKSPLVFFFSYIFMMCSSSSMTLYLSDPVTDQWWSLTNAAGDVAAQPLWLPVHQHLQQQCQLSFSLYTKIPLVIFCSLFEAFFLLAYFFFFSLVFGVTFRWVLSFVFVSLFCFLCFLSALFYLFLYIFR